MAEDSDGCIVTTVVTCEGDLSDPEFVGRFELVLNGLGDLLGDRLKVRKLEPWNSVRVTLSIPREAALRLRQLASDGAQQLRALGILSVQVEGDQVISLRLAGSSVSAEPQEIILTTGQDATPGPSSAPDVPSLSQLFQGTVAQPAEPPPPPPPPNPPPTEKVQFRSPNVVCPPDSIVPKVPMSSSTPPNTTPSTTKSYAGPFPFTSMNQAMQSRDNLGTSTNYNNPPPPYPGKQQQQQQQQQQHQHQHQHQHQPVNISSPLLVNLLQTDGVQSPKSQNETDVTNSISNCSNATAQTTQVAKPVHQKQTFVVQKPVQSVRSAKPQHGPQTSAGSILSSVSIPQQQTPPVPPKFMPKSIPAAQSVGVVTQSAPPIRANPNHLNIKISASLNAIPVVPKVEIPAQSSAQKPVTTVHNNNNNSSAMNNSNNRAVPYRSYPTFANPWDQPPMPQIQELTPTLTDLKADLDQLLPSLDFVGSPPEILEELTSSVQRASVTKTVYLINPLTGELEPHTTQETEEEELPSDVFTDLPSPNGFSDDDTNSITRPDMMDHSDSESKSGHSDGGKFKYNKRNRDKGRDSPNLKQEKIKLRLKLEKSEPVSPAYKVDVSFINTQQPKKAIPGGEELRVPPLHISLRGRNAVINNKKKIKANSDGGGGAIKTKMRKLQDTKVKKEDHLVNGVDATLSMMERLKNHVGEMQKLKKPKLNHEHREKLNNDLNIDYKNDATIAFTHYKEKLKERRGSDSELARTNKKHGESNGILSVDKKRRLSQTEERNHESQTTSVLGSTNTGTVSAALSAHKIRKDKLKLKETFKCKDLNRHKSYSKNIAEKLAKQVVPLPLAGDLDMEAKFKQRLLEEPERIAPKIPHRTVEIVHQDNGVLDGTAKVVDLIHTLTDPVEVKDKPPEAADNCNTPERKPDIVEKQPPPSRSPNSGGQGEDSGIESMDALSEKSPNQASQSPHADIQDALKAKSQVPDMLDIEAQLAKMEGFTGDDLNETNHNNQTKEQCCALQEAPPSATPIITDQLPQVEVSLIPLKTKQKETDLDPLPIRVTPPLYTYSNPEKSSRGDSPTSDDPDGSNQGGIVKSKSLLEQLLIEIPENQTPSSPSPAARSVRTRASSKLNSPELNSPVMMTSKQSNNRVPQTTKRKRHESDGSNNGVEDTRSNKKPRKSSENAAELIKSCISMETSPKPGSSTVANNALNANKKTTKTAEESSDSDEPLIEIAGKVRKNNSNLQASGATPRTKVKPLIGGSGGGVVGTGGIVKTVSINTRRSVRTIPALNTRSKGDKSQPDVDVLRRKTRSAVSEGEGKRRKDVK